MFQQRGCAGCHTINGTPAAGKTGPNLTHFASRTTLAAGIMETNAENVKTWLKDPPTVKPGSIMPNLGLNDEELDALASYLLSLK
jgi:cytochrome c oxidase subunit 2